MAKPLAYDPEYALNAICPYYTMFPLEYPLHVLKTKAKTKSIVLDPFCGRGTTIFAARHLGHLPWGIDTSPIAVAIARAKLATATTEEVIQLAENLIQIEPKHIPTTTFFRAAFHKETLRELCALREGLLRIKYDTSASVILRAAALGCLHGPLNKTKDLSYFSNQMPRTFSAKPDYAVKYWKELVALKSDGETTCKAFSSVVPVGESCTYYIERINKAIALNFHAKQSLC